MEKLGSDSSIQLDYVLYACTLLFLDCSMPPVYLHGTDLFVAPN